MTTNTNAERNAAIAKRPPSFVKNVRTMIKLCDWPEGGRFTVKMPGGSLINPSGQTIAVGGRGDAACDVLAACWTGCADHLD